MSSFLCVSYVCVGGVDHHDILVSKIDFLFYFGKWLYATYIHKTANKNDCTVCAWYSFSKLNLSFAPFSKVLLIFSPEQKFVSDVWPLADGGYLGNWV